MIAPKPARKLTQGVRSSPMALPGNGPDDDLNQRDRDRDAD